MFDPRPLCCSSLTTTVGGTKDTNIVDSESPYHGTNRAQRFHEAYAAVLLRAFYDLASVLLPRVVIKLYHTMTSRRVPHPTVIHFSIDGIKGKLQATDIAAEFHFLTVLANTADYRLWPHPLPREMVHILSRDVIAGSIFFRRQLPSSMLLIDHILRSNLFPL